MNAPVFLSGRRVRLDDRDLLGEGGEGRVYRVGDRAVKIFLAPDATREQKLRAFPSGLPARVVAPLELVTDDRGTVIGFAMRSLEAAVDLQRFGERRWREGQVGNRAVLRLFRDLGQTVARVHGRGVVVGDLNDGNVVVTPPSPATSDWTPWLIDADSMQFGAHRCVVAHERFLDPRLYGVDLLRETALSRESDWYALAVLLFASLLYVHPFGGSHPSHPTLLRRAEARCSVLRGDVKLPHVALRPDILPDDTLDWFRRVFERDVREPLPTSVLDGRFVRCSCGAEHARASCPLCTTRVHVAPVIRARGQLRATRIFASRRGRILAAAVHDGLRYVHEEEDALVREDGTVLLRRGAGTELDGFFDDPDRLVRIAGHATWLGARGRIARLVGHRIVETIPVGRVRGGALAADAGIAGLVHADGDVLVRGDGTRLGQILEGQTHVRIGGSLGFAFYRAGAVTVAFVFDPRRGALRQVEAFPHIEGKLLGWSAVFDDAHVLVTLATEHGGRVRHAAHLLDARGHVVASDPTGDVIPASLAGRALAGGQLLVTRDDGLVLLRAERQDARFLPLRVFADAQDLVPLDADLLVGPGGSIFAVTHDEILQLCFTP